MHVDGAGLNNVGRDRVLIAKRAEAVGVRLGGGLKNPQVGGGVNQKRAVIAGFLAIRRRMPPGCR